MRRDLPLLGLLLLLVLAAPAAEAKGGYGGSGSRSTCYPVDTNGDNVVSSQERSEQCGDATSWPILALLGGGAVAGLWGMSKLRPSSLPLGAKGTINDKRSFTVAGILTYSNGEGDRWKEYLLKLSGGEEAWLEVDGSEATVHRLWRGARASLDPPAVDGRAIVVQEQGKMRLEKTEGSLPLEERTTWVRYADGRTADGRPVSIESDETGVVVYESFPAHLHRKGRIVLHGPAAARWK